MIIRILRICDDILVVAKIRILKNNQPMGLIASAVNPLRDDRVKFL